MQVAIATLLSLEMMLRWRDKKAREYLIEAKPFYLPAIRLGRLCSLKEGKWYERKLMALQEEVGVIVQFNRLKSKAKAEIFKPSLHLIMSTSTCFYAEPI